jgi:uncharacterized protein YcnI
MRLRIPFALMLASLVVTSVSAHLMVSPPQSKIGITQKYEMRAHNEGKVAATSIELEIPDGVTVVDVAKPPTGTFSTSKTGTRITLITWQVEVPPGKYVALPFTAKNPDSGTEVRWNLREHLADGTVVEWSDRPGAQEKGPMTKLATASATAPAGGAEPR